MANRKISELQSRTPALSDLILVGDPSSGYSYKCTVTALATIIETDIADGFVTIGTTQTISGAKTFSNNLTLTSVANTPTDPDKFLTLNASNVVTYRTGAEVLSDIGGASSSSISGTTNYVAKFTSSSAVGNSTIQDSGSLVTIGSNTTISLNAPELTLNQGTNSVSLINFKENNVLINRISSSGATLSFTTNNSGTPSIVLGSSGTTSFGTIPNATIDTDKFLVSDSGVLKYRTGSELLSDIGAASAALYVPYTGATTNVNLGTRTITANGVYSIEGTYVANTYGLYGRNAANNAYNLLVGITGQDKVYIDGSGSGTIMNGTLTLSVINNATIDTDTFLVSDSGVIKYRTGAEVLSDIGGASSSSISGTTNYIPKFTSSSAIGNSVIYESGGSIGIGTTSPNLAGATNGLSVNSSNYSVFELNQNNARAFYIYSNAGESYIGTFATAPLIFRTNDTERLRISSTGNVGIGTSSPAAKLDVQGSSSDQIRLRTAATEYYGIGRNSSTGYLDFYGSQSGYVGYLFGGVNGTRMTLDASGNLGLGVSPSAWASGGGNLQLKSGVNISWSGQDGYLAANQFWSGSSNIYISNGFATQYAQEAGVHKWRTAPSGTAGNAISFTQAMTLDASGRLGIGTTSPSTLLEVAGVIRGASLNVYGSTDPASTSPYLYSPSTGALGIGANGSERMRITSAGDVGIGTTTPGAKLEVNGAIKTAAPSGGTAAAWKLGNKLSTAVTLDTGNYIPVEVNGTTYYLALVTLN